MNKKFRNSIEDLTPAVIVMPVFCLGIVFAKILNLNLLFLLTALFVVLLVSFFSLRRDYSVFLLLLAVFLSGEACFRNAVTLSNDHVDNIIKPASLAARLSGMVISDPQEINKKTTFLFRLENIIVNEKTISTNGIILVNYSGDSIFSYGERFILEGKLYKPFSFGIGSGFNYRDYLMRQGIYRILNVKDPRQVQSLGRGLANPLKKFSYWIKHRIKKAFARNLDEDRANLLNGIILGERANLDATLKEAFVRTGTAHILAISGLNVGIVAFMVLVLLKAMSIPARVRYLMAIVFLIIHAVMVGLQPSIVRATVMGVILLVGFMLQRQVNIYNSLATAVIFILVINPMQLFDIGFQLSFISVYAIVYLAPKIDALLIMSKEINKALQFILQSFSVSFSASLGTVGIIASNFKVLSLISVVANLVIVPLVNLILVLGFCLFMVDCFMPQLSVFFAKTVGMSLSILVLVTKYLSNLPFSCLTW